MPLSEQEQRLLEEMERSLYTNDSDFVATVGRSGRPNYTVTVLGVLGALVGIAVVVAGVVLRLPLLGVAGFVVMLVGVLFAIAPPRRKGDVRPASAGARAPRPSTSRPAQSSSFMDRLNQRWERRQDGDDRR
ncbi:DUF3040 domain-containing protein [Frigoribacterium salinisoli]